MHLFYYLYIVVVVIPFKQIKVMKLKAFLQLPKSEIQSQFLTENLSNIEILNLLGTDLITTGTGTTGETMIHSFGTSTTTGTYMDSIGITGLIMGVLFLGTGYLLDRKFNLNQDQDQESKKIDKE